MNRLSELSISVIVLLIALYIECSSESLRIIRKDFRTTSWMFCLILIAIFSIGVSLYKRQDKEHKERLIADFIAGMTDRYAINLYKSIK